MRRFLLAAACLLTFSTATQAQTLRIALREDPDILDPTLARSYVGRIVFAGLCDKLFDLNEKLEIVPQLATAYEWADAKTLILHLRQGVVFHNGEKFDAAAVKFSLERHLTMPASFRRSEIGTIDQVEIVDSATVRIVLKAATSPLLAQLTDRAGMMYPPKATEAAGKDFGQRPICSGPFQFVERVAQDRIVLERFPGYWDAKAVHFDKVVYRPMPDSTVLTANLRAGSIDLAERVLPTDVATIEADAKLRIVSSPALGYEGITFNLANGDRSKAPIDQSALLRQAFEAALDRKALVDVVFAGKYQPNAQAISPASPYYIPDIPTGPRDLARAKALVRQSGIPTPIAVSMNVPNTPDRAQLAEVIQAMVREAGFELKINLIEFASSLQAAAQGNFETYLIGWSGRADPDGNLYSFMHTGGGQNDAHYSNPVVDDMLDRARQISDVADRRAAYAKMWQAQRADMPLIYLFSPVNIVGHTAKLTGFRAVPDGMIRLQGLALGK